jgi:YVTN family beta-propeller protein
MRSRRRAFEIPEKWGNAYWRGAIVTALVLVLAAASAQGQTVTTTVGAGTNPNAVAVNPATNQIYVANFSSGNVTVIDGATNSTTTVGAGTGPQALAVNPVTNTIYVAKLQQRQRHGD